MSVVEIEGSDTQRTRTAEPSGGGLADAESDAGTVADGSAWAVAAVVGSVEVVDAVTTDVGGALAVKGDGDDELLAPHPTITRTTNPKTARLA
jgi:hypothetical protein